MQKEVTEIRKDVSSILQLLKGNDLDKDDKGFVGEVNKLRQEVDSLKKFKERVIYIGIGMALPATYGVFGVASAIIKAIAK